MLAAVAFAGTAAWWGEAALGARDPLVSRYTFAEHVFPILRDRCGVCHGRRASATPLLSYTDAVAHAASIRAQLTNGAMPPWFVTAGSPDVRGGHALSNRERDILITWAAGGTPAGDLSNVPPVASGPPTWRAGTPDRVLELPEVTLSPGSTEARRTFTLATGLAQDVWLRGVDVLPSEDSIARMVTVALEDGPVLAAWVPGEGMTSTPADVAFKVPARALLRVDVLYRTRPQDPTPVGDRTRLGLYFADPAGALAPLRTLTVDDAPLNAAVRLLAVRTTFTEPLDAVRLEATLPDGGRVPLLDLRGARPDWGRRYWLAAPVDLPAGTTVSVHVSGENPATELLVVSPAALRSTP